MLAALIVYGLSQGTFDLVDGHELEPLDLPRLHVRVRDQGAALPVPRLAARRVPRGAARGAAVLSGVIAKAGAYGMLRIAITKFPEPTSYYRTTILVLAAAALVYGSLLAFRAPDIRGVIAYSSLAQIGADRDRASSPVNEPRARRRGAADGRPRPRLDLAVPARRHGRAADDSPDEFALLGGMARGRPALATLLLTVGVISLAVPRLGGVRRRVPDPRGRLPAGWWWAASARSRSCSRRCTCCALISAVLHEARGAAVTDDGARPPPGRARRSSCRSSACCSPSRRGRPRSRSTRSRAITDSRRPQGSRSVQVISTAARRLVRALAGPRAARGRRARAARRRARPALVPAAVRRDVCALGYAAASSSRSALYVIGARSRESSRDAFHRDRWTALAR